MSDTLVLHGATTIPCNGENELADSVVVVEGDRITAVGDATTLGSHLTGRPGDGVTVIDVRGKYIIPGLVNLHEHLDMHRIPGTILDRVGGPVETLVLQAAGNAILDLAMGVTTLRDLGAMGATNIIIRDAIDAGRLVGPRIYACGQMISITGGHGQPMCAEADGPDDVRRVTRAQIKRGADVIKVCASGGVVTSRRENPMAQQLTDAELRAAVEEAHNAGLRVASHAQPPVAVKASVLAGVDTVEHAAFLDDEGADLLAEHDVFLVPTVDDSFTVASQGHRFGRPQWQIDSAASTLEPRMTGIRRAIKAGVELGIGSDVVGECGREMARLVECGLTPMQALESGTRIGARVLGVGDELGTVEPGKLADLVVLDENPLVDVGVCDRAVHLVVKGGTVHRPADLINLVPGMAANIELTTEAPTIVSRLRPSS